ncbi:glutamate-cysteine ligase family protein [Streptomyces sp. QTS52]
MPSRRFNPVRPGYPPDPRRPTDTRRPAGRALAPVETADAFPGGSRLTREPGGQVEPSSPSALSLTECVEAMAADLAVLREPVERAGLTLVGLGLDPYREPPRVLDHPRYQAMESFFDRGAPGAAP